VRVTDVAPTLVGREAPLRASDPTRLRRRAFFALRELLAALARRQPLVVFVDGVQWGDKDSAALLLELVRPPDAPPLLLVMIYRDEDLQTSPFLFETRGHWPALAELRTLAIGPLTDDATRRLLYALRAGDTFCPGPPSPGRS
jgi:eukaryotic-like serine/threonine-protein kinase